MDKLVELKKTQAITNVLLKKDIPQGRKGQVITVKSGYYRNYLEPNKLAIVATKSIKIQAQKEKIELENKFEKNLEKHRKSLSAIEKKVFKFSRRAKSTGELYGSVSSGDLRAQIEEIMGERIPDKVFEGFTPLKNIGSHRITLTFGKGDVELNVDIIKEEK